MGIICYRVDWFGMWHCPQKRNLEEKGALQGFWDENKDLSIEHSTLQTHTIPYNDKPNLRFIPK